MVVLPAPFGPRKPNISPGKTPKSTPSTALTGPFLLEKYFFKSLVKTTGSGMCVSDPSDEG